jgi:PAS domain S-box-containing protein
MNPPEQRRALIVNDDPSQLRLISAVLRHAEIDALCCLGAEEALRVMNVQRVDIVITDLHMPGIDGWRFCQLLRSPEFESFNEIPILVVSATFSGSDPEQMSIDMGANGFLSSPFPPSVLQEYVRAILDGRTPRPTMRALLVMPPEADTETLRRAFEQVGYSVEVALSGTEGRRLCEEQRPQILIIDDPVSDLTCEELLDRTTRPGSRMVTVVVTADRSAEKAIHIMRRGADGYLHKPFEAADVIELCERVRRQRSLIRIEELLDERTRALRESEARWRSLFEAIPAIVLVHDDHGVICHVNRTGAERLGWSSLDLVGRNLNELADPRPAESRDLAQVRSFESVYLSRSGRRIEVEVSERPIRYEGKIAVLSVAHDVTASRDLARQKANFLAMLTHDIKNPLAVILGFADMLPDLGGLNAEQLELLERLRHNAQTVLALVANYLGLSQIEAGSLTLTRKPLDLNAQLTEVSGLYAGEARRKRIAVELDLADDLPAIDVDALAMERVLGNLVHNAIKFTPEGGRIEIRSRREDGRAIVDVADTGPGIVAEDLPSLFRPYRQAETRRPHEGTGLGLFIARTLVEAHGGEVTVDSSPGLGSCFSVSIPLSG